MKPKNRFFLMVVLFFGVVPGVFATTDTVHLGPVCAAGGCGAVTVAFDVYHNGTLYQANWQAGSANGCFPNSTGLDFSGDRAPGITVTYRMRVGDPAGAGSWKDPHIWGANDTISGTVAVGCTTNDCMVTNVVCSFSATNNTSGYQLWAMLLDGQTLCGNFAPSGGATYMQLAPGQSATMTSPAMPVGCGGSDGNFSFQQIQGYSSMTTCGGGQVVISPSGFIGPSYGPTVSTPSGGGTPGGTGIGAGGTTTTTGSPGTTTTYDPSTNAPILFNPTNSPGGTNGVTDGTMQAGLDAIYSAININGANAATAAAQLDADVKANGVVLQGGTNLAGQQLSIEAAGFGITTNVLIAATNLLTQQTNLANKTLLAISNQLVFNTNAFFNLSNAVMTSGSQVTNWLGQNIASNLANARMLSNVIVGVSNAVVSSGSNQAVFLSNAFYSVMGSLTNLGGGGTNQFSDSGITNAIGSQHKDITNYLSQLVDTNGPGSGYLVRGTDIESFDTNSDAATAALGTSFDAAKGVGAAMISDAGSLQSGLGSGGSGGSDFMVSIAGHSLNLDPDVIIPGSCDFVYYLTELVVVIAFYLSCGKLYYVFMSDLSKLRTGAVPNLNAEIFGVGGNFLGAAVHPAICAAIITLWAAILVVFVGKFPTPGMITETFGHANSVIGTGGGVAWHLIRRTIPIDLILSLAATRMILQFTMGNLIVAVAGIMRFFIGG